jgi:hypothetical protein
MYVYLYSSDELGPNFLIMLVIKKIYQLTDPVSETLCSLESWKMDKVQKPSNSKHNERMSYKICAYIGYLPL